MFLVKVVCITHHGNVISVHAFTYYAAFKTTVVSQTVICHIMMCLLHVLVSTGPSTWRSPTKKTAVTDSVKGMHMWSQHLVLSNKTAKNIQM
jgi:hypothetical protein